MAIVLRHAIDQKWALELFQSEVSKVDQYLPLVRAHSRGLSILAGVAGMIGKFGSIVAPDAPETARGVVLAAQANTAVLVFATIETPPQYCPLGEGPPVTYTDPVNPASANVGVWIDACELTLISRQPTLLTLLQPISTDFLRTTSSAPETTFQAVELLRAIITLTKPTRSKAFRWKEEYHATCTGKSEHHKAVRLLGIPYLEVIKALELGDGAQFETALVEACRQHGKFYGATEKLRKDTNGYVSLQLTAVAALAYDRGLKFDVNVSEYVPASWITGEVFRSPRNN